jgi:hypothetical protein
LSGNVFICRRVGDVAGRKQNCNRSKPRIFHATTRRKIREGYVHYDLPMWLNC